jgi:hypothetical protein
VRQAVLDNDFQTMMGKVKYDKTGVATSERGCQWMDGKEMTVYPFELTTYKMNLLRRKERQSESGG